MTRSREELIRELTDEPRPPRRLASVRVAALGWLAASALVVAVVTLASGPLRPGVFAQLAGEPGFALELALGLSLSALAGLGLMRLRIPGLAAGVRAARPALALGFAWIAVLAIQLVALEPASTLGARALCWLQVLLFSLPPLAGALALARRAAPLERGWTGLLAGLAAGSLPALAMQLGCMDEPLHALIAHLGPVLLVAAAGATLGPLVLRRV